MVSATILDRIKNIIDPAIRTFLILGVPLVLVYSLGKFVFPANKALRGIRFRGLPSSWDEQKLSKTSAKWTKHLVLLSRSISNGDDSDRVFIQRFILTTLSVFVLAYITYGFWAGLFSWQYFQYRNLFDRWLIFISLMASSIPYCIMRIKLHRVRVKNSYDLMPAINTMLLKYMEYRGNLYYAIFETTKELKGDILKAFVSLLPSLQGLASSSIEEAVELFIFRIKTTWAIQLGILIHKSEEQGDNIEQGIRWIITDMSEVTKITEELKSENRETIQLGYMPAFLLPAVVYLNQYPSMGKSWHYYFQTTQGIRMIVFTLLFTLICALIAFIIQKPRNEV